MDSTKIPGNEFLDILFYGRNKDYGAYELRIRYNRRVRNAMMGTAAIMLVLTGGYVVSNRLMAADHPHLPVFTDAIKLDEVKLPEADRVIPPPPPKTSSAPPPAASTIDFATMVITDKPVDPDEMPPRHEDIGNKAIGFENTEGRSPHPLSFRSRRKRFFNGGEYPRDLDSNDQTGDRRAGLSHRPIAFGGRPPDFRGGLQHVHAPLLPCGRRLPGEDRAQACRDSERPSKGPRSPRSDFRPWARRRRRRRRCAYPFQRSFSYTRDFKARPLK